MSITVNIFIPWMMKKIFELREKYDLHMKVERFVSENVPEEDTQFIKK